MRMKRFVAALALMVFLGGSVALASAQARAAAASTPSSQPAKVTFRRIFQGSSPEYIELSIWDDQKTATYEIRQMDDDPGPAPFEVGEALRTKIFGLTAQLHNFQGQDLDVHRKIANLGEKTFRWEQAGVVHETKFNYTLNQAAAQLLQIFEGLARQQEHYELITRRMIAARPGRRTENASHFRAGMVTSVRSFLCQQKAAPSNGWTPATLNLDAANWIGHPTERQSRSTVEMRFTS